MGIYVACGSTGQTGDGGGASQDRERAGGDSDASQLAEGGAGKKAHGGSGRCGCG